MTPSERRDHRTLFDACISSARDPASGFYRLDGATPRTGAGHREAFWAGYRGEALAFIRPGTLAHTCWRAGRAWAREANIRKQAGGGSECNE